MQLVTALKSKFQIVYKDPYGNILNIFNETNLFSLELSLRETDFGSLYIDFPNELNISYFKKDYILEVWRKVGDLNYYLEGDTVFFIRLIRYKYNEKGEKYIHILAYSAMNLLDRRIVPYMAMRDGNDNYITGYAYKEGKCDDVIAAVINENFGTLAVDTTRRYPSSLFSNCYSPSVGPLIQKEFSCQKTLPLIQSIVDYSIEQGTYMAVDVIKATDFVLVPAIFIGSRGIDRGNTSSNTLLFSVERGNLSYASVAKDYVGEFNFIYADNTGDSETRILYPVSDAASINLTPWSRVEDYLSTNLEEQTAIQHKARGWLQSHLGKTKVNGHIIQTDDCMYGVHYNFGDIVNVSSSGISVDVHIDSVEIKVSRDNADEIKIYARNLDDTEY